MLINIRKIIGILLVSIIFVYSIFPVLINLTFVEGFLKEEALPHFFTATAVLLLLFIYSWAWARNLWKRYRNTFFLKNRQIVFPECAILFIIISALFIWLFQTDYIPTLSCKFKHFILLNGLFVGIWFLSSWFVKDKPKPTEKNISLLSDTPINNLDEDLLRRRKFIIGLKNEIIEIPFDDSFVFGLYGRWGEGKSSVKKMLINELENNDNLLLVDFDPWYFKNEDAILAAFYGQIEQAISQKFLIEDLKKTFKKYQKLISSGLSNAGLKLDIADLFQCDKSLQAIKLKIEEHIKMTGKKLIIFIDDIDRLQPKEVLLIFKLVRLNTEIKNTIFILFFDPAIVCNYFKKKLRTDPEFLDKIVQKPISLPAIEQSAIDNFLDKQTDNLFSELSVSEEDISQFENEFDFVYQSQIYKLINTLRHAKRYINGLRTTLPPVKNEVNLSDLFMLEVIRIFYPEIHADIWQNPWFYIPTSWMGGDSRYYASPFMSMADNEQYPMIKKHIEDVVKNVVKNEQKEEIVKKILKKIFFVEVENAFNVNKTGYDDMASRYRIEKRITHPACFRKYFMLQVPSSELSDEFIITTLAIWNNADNSEKERVIEKNVAALKQTGMLLELLKKLKLFKDWISNDTALALVRYIYKNIHIFSRKVLNDSSLSEYDKAQFLLLRLINDKIEQSKIHETLQEVVTQTSDFYFAVEIVFSCKREEGGSNYNIYNSIQIDELQNQVSGQLQKYFITEQRDVFDELPEKKDWIFVVHLWATNWKTFTGGNTNIVSGYVFSLIEDNVEKFIKFLTPQRRVSTDSDNRVFNLDEDKLNRIYDLERLQRLAQKFRNDSSLSEEDKGVIEMFLEEYDKYRNKETTS